jgi:hypothetical protein
LRQDFVDPAFGIAQRAIWRFEPADRGFKLFAGQLLDR